VSLYNHLAAVVMKLEQEDSHSCTKSWMRIAVVCTTLVVETVVDVRACSSTQNPWLGRDAAAWWLFPILAMVGSLGYSDAL
jgi:hypothetical protein